MWGFPVLKMAASNSMNVDLTGSQPSELVGASTWTGKGVEKTCKKDISFANKL